MRTLGLSYPPELRAELESEAREDRDFTNDLGAAFRTAQHEAYRAWCAWERADASRPSALGADPSGNDYASGDGEQIGEADEALRFAAADEEIARSEEPTLFYRLIDANADIDVLVDDMEGIVFLSIPAASQSNGTMRIGVDAYALRSVSNQRFEIVGIAFRDLQDIVARAQREHQGIQVEIELGPYLCSFDLSRLVEVA